MIPQVTLETITETATKMAELTEKEYKASNPDIFRSLLLAIKDRQPYLTEWFVLYCQSCSAQGMGKTEIAAMTMAFVVIMKALYDQDEISNLEDLFKK